MRGFRCGLRRPESKKVKAHSFPLTLFVVDEEATAIATATAAAAAAVAQPVIKEEVLSFETDVELHEWADKLSRMLVCSVARARVSWCVMKSLQSMLLHRQGQFISDHSGSSSCDTTWHLQVLVNENAAALLKYNQHLVAQERELREQQLDIEKLNRPKSPISPSSPSSSLSVQSPHPPMSPVKGTSTFSPLSLSPIPARSPVPTAAVAASSSASRVGVNRSKPISAPILPPVDLVVSQLVQPIETAPIATACIEIALTVWTSYGEPLKLPSVFVFPDWTEAAEQLQQGMETIEQEIGLMTELLGLEENRQEDIRGVVRKRRLAERQAREETLERERVARESEKATRLAALASPATLAAAMAMFNPVTGAPSTPIASESSTSASASVSSAALDLAPTLPALNLADIDVSDVDVGISPFLASFAPFLQHLSTVFIHTVQPQPLSANVALPKDDDAMAVFTHPLVTAPLLTAWQTLHPSVIAPTVLATLTGGQLQSQPSDDFSDLSSFVHVVTQRRSPTPFYSVLLAALARYRAVHVQHDPRAHDAAAAPHIDRVATDMIWASLNPTVSGTAVSNAFAAPFFRLCKSTARSVSATTAVSLSHSFTSAVGNVTSHTTTSTTVTTTTTSTTSVAAPAFVPYWLAQFIPESRLRFIATVSLRRNLARRHHLALTAVNSSLRLSTYPIPWQVEPDFLASGWPDAHLTTDPKSWTTTNPPPWGGWESVRDHEQAMLEAVGRLPASDAANPMWWELAQAEADRDGAEREAQAHADALLLSGQPAQQSTGDVDDFDLHRTTTASPNEDRQPEPTTKAPTLNTTSALSTSAVNSTRSPSKNAAAAAADMTVNYVFSRTGMRSRSLVVPSPTYSFPMFQAAVSRLHADSAKVTAAIASLCKTWRASTYISSRRRGRTPLVHFLERFAREEHAAAMLEAKHANALDRMGHVELAKALARDEQLARIEVHLDEVQRMSCDQSWQVEWAAEAIHAIEVEQTEQTRQMTEIADGHSEDKAVREANRAEAAMSVALEQARRLTNVFELSDVTTFGTGPVPLLPLPSPHTSEDTTFPSHPSQIASRSDPAANTTAPRSSTMVASEGQQWASWHRLIDDIECVNSTEDRNWVHHGTPLQMESASSADISQGYFARVEQFIQASSSIMAPSIDVASIPALLAAGHNQDECLAMAIQAASVAGHFEAGPAAVGSAADVPTMVAASAFNWNPVPLAPLLHAAVAQVEQWLVHLLDTHVRRVHLLLPPLHSFAPALFAEPYSPLYMSLCSPTGGSAFLPPTPTDVAGQWGVAMDGLGASIRHEWGALPPPLSRAMQAIGSALSTSAGTHRSGNVASFGYLHALSEAEAAVLSALTPPAAGAHVRGNRRLPHAVSSSFTDNMMAMLRDMLPDLASLETRFSGCARGVDDSDDTLDDSWVVVTPRPVAVAHDADTTSSSSSSSSLSSNVSSSGQTSPSRLLPPRAQRPTCNFLSYNPPPQLGTILEWDEAQLADPVQMRLALLQLTELATRVHHHFLFCLSDFSQSALVAGSKCVGAMILISLSLPSRAPCSRYLSFCALLRLPPVAH